MNSFNTELLSGVKYKPALQNTSLSANGVNVISLSTNDVGICFNKKTPTGNLINTNVYGSIFRIDRVYHLETFSVITLGGLSNTFTFLSSTNVVPASAISSQIVSTPNSRRKHYLGYR